VHRLLYLPFMLVVALLGACGGSSVEVPVGLTVHCARAFEGGELPGDGTWLDAKLGDSDCLLYRLNTDAGVQYAVQALIKEASNVDVIVSSLPDFTDLVTASTAFGAAPESARFRSERAGNYFVALIGRTEPSEASVRAVQSVASPLGVNDCDTTLDGGELVVDTAARSDLLFPSTCILYTFEGTADSIHRLTLEMLDNANVGPKRLLVAADRDFTEVVDSESYLGKSTSRYFVTNATKTYYVLTRAELFSDALFYDLSVARGNAPLGLRDLCFQAEEKGQVSKDWSAVTSSVAPRECHIYTLSTTQGLRYFVGPGESGNQLLRITIDPAFLNPASSVFEDVRGVSTKALDATASQTLHIAVLTYETITRDYSLRGLEAPPPPPGLSYSCNRSRAEGALVVGAAATTSSVENGECVTRTLAVQAGVTYAVTATAAANYVNLNVAQDAAHTQSLGSASTLRASQGVAFTAPTTGNVYVAVSGRGDVSSFSLQAVPTTPAPAGLGGKCTSAINSGALTVGGGGKIGFAPVNHCVIYSFPGTSGTSYTVNVSGSSEYDNPDLVVASNASFSTIVDQEATPDGDNTIVFTARATQTFYLAIYGFQGTQYNIEVNVSPPPPSGLATRCTSARSGGTLVVGGAPTSDEAVQGQCILFSFPANVGTSYTVTMYATGGDPSLIVASNATFTSVLTIQATPGGQTYTFQASATQSYYLAVFPADATTTGFEIFVTSP